MGEWSLAQRRAAAVVFIALIVVALGAWAMTYTPIFRAHTIRVVGARTFRPDAIRELAGIDGSTNVVHVDAEAVVARLVADPWIASAMVERDLPATLVVRIVEREPVATIPALGDGSMLASDGAVLPALDAAGELPTMHAALGTPDEAQRLDAAALLSAFDPVVSQRVDDLTVGQDGSLTLTLRDGVTVDAGVAGQEGAKAAALRAVLRWAASGDHPLASIDVSASEAPSATLLNGSTVTP